MAFRLLENGDRRLLETGDNRLLEGEGGYTISVDVPGSFVLSGNSVELFHPLSPMVDSVGVFELTGLSVQITRLKGLMSLFLIEKIINKVFRGLNFTLPSTLYVGLHSQNPGSLGNYQVGGRQPITRTQWSAADNGFSQSLIDLTWTDMGSTSVAYVSLWTEAEGGEFVWAGELTSEVAISDTAFMPAGSLVVSMTECLSLGVGLSEYLRNKIVDKILRNVEFSTTPIWISLHDGDPEMIGANEISVGSYKRQKTLGAQWKAPAEFMTENLFPISFPNITGDIDHVGFWDSETGPNFLLGAPLIVPKTGLVEGSVVRFSTSDLSVYFNTCVPGE